MSLSKSKHLLKRAAKPNLTLLCLLLTPEDSIVPRIAKLGCVLEGQKEQDDKAEEDCNNDKGDATIQDSEEVEEVCLFKNSVTKDGLFRNHGGLC